MSPINQIRWGISTLSEAGPILSHFSFPSFLRQAATPGDAQIYGAVFGTIRVYFIKRGQSATFCDRAIKLTGADLTKIASSIFRDFSDINYVEFPHLLDDGASEHRNKYWRFVTHECTLLPLGSDWNGFSTHFSKKIRYAYNRLRREMTGKRVEFRLNKPGSEENVRSIISLNRAKIESKKQHYGVDAAYEDAIVAACVTTGADASLFVNERLIGGAIFYTCQGSVFLQAVGYDPDFAKYSPSLICLHEAIHEFQSAGFNHLNLMWGHGSYKERLGGRRQPLFTYLFPRAKNAKVYANIFMTAFRLLKVDFWQRMKPVIKVALRRSS